MISGRSVELHSPVAIRERLSRPPKQSHLRDFIYGGIDGAVTTSPLSPVWPAQVCQPQ